jgi:hypothetical protein
LSPPPFAKPLNKSSRLPIEASIELGVIFQASLSNTSRWLTNQSDREIHVAKIEGSCECVDVRLSKSRIASGERVLAQCTYDGTKEPTFVGALAIDVILTNSEGNRIGKIDVSVEVRSKNDFPEI